MWCRVLEPDLCSQLVRLRELRLRDNSIRSIALPASCSQWERAGEALAACCPALVALDLSGNRLLDVPDCVDRLCALPCLQELWLCDNPLARKQVKSRGKGRQRRHRGGACTRQKGQPGGANVVCVPSCAWWPQVHRTQLVARCPGLQRIDGVAITQQERDYVQAVASLQGTPRRAADGASSAAASLLLAAAEGRAAAAPAGSPMPGCNSRVAAPVAGSMHGSGVAMPAVLNSEALGMAAAIAARQGLLGGSTTVFQPSVPSIQSGVLLLTGAASFGLAGTGLSRMGATSWGGTPCAGGMQPQPPPRGRRMTTGSVPGGSPGAIASSRAGEFTVRQATFNRGS
jgi:hypothetical protein